MRSGGKKYLISVLMIALLFALVHPVRAELCNKFSEKVDVIDNIVIYKIEVTPNTDICGLTLEIEYSEEQVQVKNCTVGAVLAEGIVKSNSSIGGKVILSYISMTPLKEGGSVIAIELETLTTDNKEIDIDCTITECIDQECNEITYGYVKETVINPRYIEKIPNQSDNSTSDDHGSSDGTGVLGNTENEQNDTISPKPPSNDQNSSVMDAPIADQNETTLDGTMMPIVNGSDVIHNTENSGADSAISSDIEQPELEDSQAQKNSGEQTLNSYQDTKRNSTRWLMVGIGVVVLLTMVCLAIVIPILSKRRRDNEK